MVFVSDLIAKLGPRLFAAIGAVMMGISLFLIASIRDTTDLFIAYLAMAPAFAMLTTAAAANIVGSWFNEKRGLAMSFALTGGGVGGFAIVPILVWLTGRFSFEASLRIIAAATIPLLLVAVMFCIRRPDTQQVKVAASSSVDPSSATMTRRSALASAHYWTIAAPLMLAIMVQVGFIVHQVSFLLPIVGREGAGLAVFLTALMAATSRIVVGFSIDRLDQRKLCAMLLASQACALLAVLFFPSPLVAYLASAVFGFAVGVMITLPSLIIQRECPPMAFGMLSGLTLAIIQTGNAFGPSLLGWLREATGSYSLPIMMCVALELIAVAGILIRLRPTVQATSNVGMR
jgi:MFS family permease